MPLQIRPEQLTPLAFAPFGTVIENPTLSPALTPQELRPKSVEANQGSATKYLNITNTVSLYAGAPSGQPAEAKMNMFSCKPRTLQSSTGDEANSYEVPGVSLRRAGLLSRNRTSTASRREYSFPVAILERHPYTYQTFIPMGLSADEDYTSYLVIVAPTHISKTNDIVNPPDLTEIRAFLAHGRQAVTYAAGTWHAPMIVVGRSVIDFVVCQWSNGVANEDCEEFFIPKDEAPSVILNLEIDATTLYESAWSGSGSSKL